MKRMVASAALALIIHAGVFWLADQIRINRNTLTAPSPKIVTVTMSYRAPAPLPKTKKAAVKKQPKKIYKQKKPVPPPEDVVKPEPPEPKPKKNESPVPEEKDVNVGEPPVEETQSEETPDNDTEKGPRSSTRGNSVSNMTAQVEAVPLYNTNPPPKYPRTAVKRGYQGTAELMVLVNKTGSVDDVWLFESSGYSILDEAALQSVKRWSFTPGKQGDQAIDMWVRVPVRFQLQ